MSTREQTILDAALDLFAEHGFAAVGVDAIGARAGIAGPAIYTHFSSKHELLATLIDRAMDRLTSLTAVTAGEDPTTALSRLIAGHVRFALDDRLLLSVYAQEARSLPPADRRRTRRRQRRYVDHWIEVLGNCFPERSEAQREIATHGAIGLIQSVIYWPRTVITGPTVECDICRQVLGGLHSLAAYDQIETAAR